MDLLRNITDPVEHVIAEMALAGHNIVYRDGEWKHALQRSGGVQGFGERRMAQADQDVLNRRLAEVQQQLQPPTPTIPDAPSAPPTLDDRYRQMAGQREGLIPVAGGRWHTAFGGFAPRAAAEQATASAWELQQHYGGLAEQRQMAAEQQRSLVDLQPTGAMADLDIGGQHGAEDDANAPRGRDRGRGGGRRGWGGLHGGQGAGGLFFGGAALGGLLGAGSNILEQGGALAQRGAQQVGAFFENIFSVAGQSLGQTGAGAARLASGLVNLTVSGFTGAAGLGVTLASGLIGIAAMGLGAVSAMVGVTIGGAIGGILAAGVVLAGTAVSEAVGKVFGALGQVAQDALQGVVTVVRDLGGVSKDLSQATLSMRGSGGLSSGASMQALLMGTGLGQSSAQTAGQFGYGMQPMMAGARFAAFGANYDPNNPAGSMYGAARVVAGLPSFLQTPVANAMTGGNGDALLKMAQVPWDELSQTILLAQQLARGRSADDMTRLEMARGRVGMLAETVKIDILEALLPLMYRGLQGIAGFYDAHKEQIAAFVNGLPGLIEKGLLLLGEGLLTAIGWLRAGYMAAKEGWEWLKGAWAAFAGPAGFGGAGAPGGAGGGPGGVGGAGGPGTVGGGPGGHAPGDPETQNMSGPGGHPTLSWLGRMTGAWRRGASGQDRGDASWLPYMAGRHPWAAAALGLGGIPAAIAYGPRLLGAGAGLLGAGADAGAAAVGLGGSIGGGVFAGLGAIAGFSAYGIGSEYMRRRQAGQGVWGAGMGMAANAVTGPFGPLGAVLAPATWGAQALGRRFAGVPSERDEARTSASHAAAMRDRGYLDPEEQWRRIRAGETIGRPAGSIRSEQERAAARTAARTAQTDPVLQWLSKREQDLRDTLKELPNWFREAERQRQQQQPELKVSGEIGFAPEMTVKMLYQLNGQMWREFQAGVS